MDGLPTPPNEELVRPQGLRKSHGVSKNIKTVPRTLKRSSTHSHPSSPARESHSQHGDGRHKRVWKACERCRMKKTKCDGEFPCKRCKDDGLICTAGTRKKTEYKQLPPGYAEVLENTQFVLIATVQKLYSMVRSGDPWEFGEPELNDRGQPIVHNVAAKLGCLRPNSDLDLPVHSIFPEDEAGMAELARQLQKHNAASAAAAATASSASTASSILPSTGRRQEAEATGAYDRTDRASSSAASDAEHSDFDPSEPSYRQAAFGAASAVSMSPASLSYGDFDVSPPATVSADGFPPGASAAAAAAARQSPPVPALAPSSLSWMGRQASMSDFTAQQLWMASQGYLDTDMAGSGVLEPGFGGGMKPHAFSSSCRDPGVMMGMNDPMIYSGYEEDPLRPLFANPSNI